MEQVDSCKVNRYGIMAGNQISDNLFMVEDFVEKPNVQDAPSNLAIAGRYIFTPEIFDCISMVDKGKNGEIQLTDAMRLLVKSRAMYGLKFQGARYDIGNKLDFIKTNIIFGLKRPEIQEDLLSFIKDICNDSDSH